MLLTNNYFETCLPGYPSSKCEDTKAQKSITSPAVSKLWSAGGTLDSSTLPPLLVHCHLTHVTGLNVYLTENDQNHMHFPFHKYPSSLMICCHLEKEKGCCSMCEDVTSRGHRGRAWSLFGLGNIQTEKLPRVHWPEYIALNNSYLSLAVVTGSLVVCGENTSW